MKRYKIRTAFGSVLFLCILLTAVYTVPVGAAARTDIPVLSAGYIHIENPDKLENSFIKLSGLWEFYWNRFVDPHDFYSLDAAPAQSPEADAFVKVPSVWNTFINDPIAKRGKGCASYHIKLTNLKPNFRYAMFMFDKVGTAAKLYCNGDLVFSQGTASENYSQTRAMRSMDIAVLESDSQGVIDLVFHCSNSIYRKGGLWSEITFAEETHVRHWFFLTLNFNFFYAGALLSIMLYHLFLFLFRKYDWPSFYFSLFAFSIFLRSVSADFSLLLYYLPAFPYGFDMKIEYSVVFMAPVCFMLYLVFLYNIDLKSNSKKNLIVKLVIYIGIFLGVAVWSLPLRWANYLVVPCLTYLLISATIVLVVLFMELRQNSFEIFLLTVLSIAVTGLGTLHDILALQMMRVPFPDLRLVSYSFIVFVFFQSLITAIRHEKASAAIELLSGNLQKINMSYMRFVPQEFLQLLKKGNITDVEMGDYTMRDVTLLCADIRNFTPISEQLGCKEVFDLLNTCLTNIAPLIRTHGGFIEKYLGDCIVAVFPDNRSNIFQCAVEMQQKMQSLKTGKPISLRIGIGIHYGKVVLGTTGSAERLSQIAVSEAVDTVMRLESLTKLYGEKVLVSGAVLKKAGNGKASQEFKFVKINTGRLRQPLEEEVFALEIPEIAIS
ncbi:adenylate/guanylate cyclase domain-containing protein [Treponema sp. OMZ 840]|uniref:adenylate/guanylate cyclase domain-containing protein n=1 Tax=Treponema sp. OMZ 840 TaxID=244313 RepID=UPI003D91774D